MSNPRVADGLNLAADERRVNATLYESKGVAILKAVPRRLWGRSFNAVAATEIDLRRLVMGGQM